MTECRSGYYKQLLTLIPSSPPKQQQQQQQLEVWRCGESARVPPLKPGSNPKLCAIRRLSLLLILVLAPRVFSWVIWVSTLLKNQHLLLQFDPEFEEHSFVSHTGKSRKLVFSHPKICSQSNQTSLRRIKGR